MTSAARIPADRLFDFAAAVYASAGMPDPDARLAADTLDDLYRLARETGITAG